MSHDAPQPPHPLAERLASALAALRSPRVLVLGAGDGRNLAPFREREIAVNVVAAGGSLATPATPYDGVLSTHGLLHGTRTAVAGRIAAIRSLLTGDGLLYGTFGSANDPRCGAGISVGGGDGWAPRTGDEAGVVHAYFDEAALRRSLTGFTILRLDERDAAEIVGRWAHAPGGDPIVHWLVEARRAAPL